MQERTSVLLQADPLPRPLTKALGGQGPFCHASSTWYGEGRGTTAQAPSSPTSSFHSKHKLQGHQVHPNLNPPRTTGNQRLQMWAHLPLWTAPPTPKLHHPCPPPPAYQIDKLANVQPLVPVGLEDSDDEAVQKVPSLLQVPALFILSFQVRLRGDEPHVAPPWPGLLAVISNLEHT